VSDDLELTAQELRAANAMLPFLRRDSLVVIADGAGSPVGLGRALAHAAKQVGGVRLVVGWSFQAPVPVESDAFTDIRVLVGGYGLREAIRQPNVHYVPVRLSSIPALLHTALKPDVLIAGVRPVDGGVGFGTEVSWMRAAVDLGIPVLAEVNHGLPASANDGRLPADQVTVISEVDRPPLGITAAPATDDVQKIAERIASLVTPGSVVQYGPGGIGDAAIRGLQVPVRVHSGIVTDAVQDLDQRGLLLDDPVTAYVVGTPTLYDWADGRPMARRVEQTHDLGYLSDLPLFAINTALEIDLTGQVNVEGFGANVVGAVGGHPDFAAGGSRAIDGLSIAALPTWRGRHRTLVSHLAAPASTARCDIDVVVTEHGIADLRGLDDVERRQALISLWDYDPTDIRDSA
jgi:acyl-CoA hydrolase